MALELIVDNKSKIEKDFTHLLHTVNIKRKCLSKYYLTFINIINLAGTNKLLHNLDQPICTLKQIEQLKLKLKLLNIIREEIRSVIWMLRQQVSWLTAKDTANLTDSKLNNIANQHLN